MDFRLWFVIFECCGFPRASECWAAQSYLSNYIPKTKRISACSDYILSLKYRTDRSLDSNVMFSHVQTKQTDRRPPTFNAPDTCLSRYIFCLFYFALTLFYYKRAVKMKLYGWTDNSFIWQFWSLFYFISAMNQCNMDLIWKSNWLTVSPGTAPFVFIYHCHAHMLNHIQYEVPLFPD